jgi:propionate CoA-transferase
VFCGTFDAKGSEIEVSAAGLHINRHGDVAKFVVDVDQITFSGPRAITTGQRVVYVTERAVFDLCPTGLRLIEVAPGIDVQRDVLDRIPFSVALADPVTPLDRSHFEAAAV